MFRRQVVRRKKSVLRPDRRRLRLLIEPLEDRRLLAVDWRNPVDSLDVDTDGFIAPLDALRIINDLNANGSRRLPAVRDPAASYLDVDGDQNTAPIDALVVINAINAGIVGPRVLTEGSRLAAEVGVTISLGQAAGGREYRFQIDAAFDTSATGAALEDVLAVYLVDPANPSQTLLDRGETGTALFTLAGTQAEFVPGLVRWDGSVVSIDTTSLSPRDTGVLKFQLLSSDSDTGSRVTIKPLSNDVDPDGAASLTLPANGPPVSAGPALNLATLTPAANVATQIENVRFDAATGRYSAELRLHNTGAAIGRDAVVTFPGLPAGVTLRNASGTTNAGAPYVNLRAAISRGGLGTNSRSDAVLIEFDDPPQTPFAITPQILAGTNHAPTLDPIGPLNVLPGGVLQVPLVATDQDGDAITFSLTNANPPSLPTGRLGGDGTLNFRPTPSQLGAYQFDIIASDGALEATQSVTLNVVADPITTTRVSGFILDVDQSPLAGMQVEIGAVQGLTLADGSFTLDLGSGPVVGDTLKVRGETFPGPLVYPFIAEKLAFILEHEVFAGVNNVITRPIFLPPLDVAGGTTIDPMQDTTVQQEVAPGEMVEVFVEAGTLMNQQGTPFTGVLSITEVPRELTPAALPDNLIPDLVVTIQPGEMVFATPAPLSFPNRAGWAPSTLMDLWSINPVTGEFDDVGDMEVSADGTTIDTISGGVRNSSWHFTVPPEPEVVTQPRRDPRNDKKDFKDFPKCVRATSMCELHSGAVIESHDLVSYQSLGIDRSPRLIYDSLRADPRPIVHFSVDKTESVSDPALRLVADMTVSRGPFQFQVPGYAGGEFGLAQGEHIFSLGAGTGEFGGALQMDLRSQPSGQYNYNIDLGRRRFTGTTFTGSSQPESGTILHVNTINSPFGSGWGLSGLLQLVENPDGTVLLIDGDGSELLFGAPPAAGQPFVAPPGDFSTLVRLPSGDFRRTTKDQTVHTFDSGNRLATVVDRHGNTTTFDYDTGGRLIKITDPVGLETVFSIGTNGRVSSITDPAARVTRFEYEAAGNLTRITDPDNSTRTFTYDADHHMTGETDQRGNRESLSYDFAGRLVQAIRKDGTVLRYQPVQVQGLLRPEATSNPLAPARARLRELANALSADGNGNVTRTQLDQAGQQIGAVDAVGPMGTTRRDGRNLAMTEIDARGNTTALRYDARGNLLNIDDSISRRAVYVMPSGRAQNDQKVLDALVASGFQPVAGKHVGGFNLIDAQEADLSSFEAVLILMDQDTEVNMPDSGQTALVNYVNAGGALVTGEPIISGTLSTLSTIFPATFGDETRIGRTTYSLTTDDSVLAVGLPDQFTFSTSDDRLDPKPGATQFFASSLTGGAGVVGWDVGAGRVLSLSSGIVTDKNTPTITVTPEIDGAIYRQLVGNAIEWAIKDPVNAYAKFTYDPVFNQMTGLTDADGRQTMTDVDPANGNVRSVTRVSFGPDGDVVTNFVYTPQGLVDTAVDPLGRVADYDYDERGRLVTKTVAKGTVDQGVIRYEYDAAGNLSATIDELGRRTEFAYDSMNRVVRVTDADPDGAGSLTAPVTTFTYDAAGNMLSQTDARGNAMRNEYDVLHRMTRRTDALSGVSTVEYDLQGNIVAQTDELGHVTRFRYDARNRLMETTDPDGGRTQFGYDADDNRTSVTDPAGNTTTFVFDARSRLIEEIDPLGKSTLYEYDEAGNLFTITDRLGRFVRFFHDELNRLGNEAWLSDAGLDNPIRYSYDKAGNLLSVVDNFATLTYTYDSRNRVISVDNAFADESPNVVLGYTYDAVGNVLSVAETIDGTSGAVTSYAYDALNRVVRETQSGGGTNDKRVDLAYDPLGLLTAIDRFSDLAGNQSVIRTEHTYDTLNRLTHIDHKRGMSVVAFENLAYDAASRITQLTDGDGSSSYSYDNRDQVTSADHSRAALIDEAFAYDNNGNRKTSSLHGSAYRTGPGNRLLSDGTYNYEYDDEGNISQRTTIATGLVRELQYDHRDRLTAVIDKNASGTVLQTTTYSYDGLDRRISRSVDSSPGVGTAPVEHFVYDREDVLLEFLDPDGSGPQPATLHSRLLHGPAVDQVFAQDDGAGGVQWLLADHLGTIRDLVDNTGVVVNHFVYDSFGNVISQNAAGPTSRYLFTGREFDPSVGLYYYRARYYDSSIGRFLSEDPIGLTGGDANLFRYVTNDPLAKVDPSGLLTFVYNDPNDQTGTAMKKAAQKAASRATPDYEVIRPDPYAVVGKLVGDVGVRTANADWGDVTEGQRFGPTDEIHTGPDSEAIIQFRDGRRRKVSELTQVAVGEIDGDAGNPKVQVLMKMGEVAAKANHPVESQADFSVKTPTATCSVRG